MCSGGGGGESFTSNAARNSGPVFAAMGVGGDGSGSGSVDPAAGNKAAAAAPTTAPNSDGTASEQTGKQSSLLITRNRKRATGTASAPGGGSGLNIPT